MTRDEVKYAEDGEMNRDNEKLYNWGMNWVLSV